MERAGRPPLQILAGSGIRPGVDWVMVFSPNAFHKQHILEGFAAGKNVFSEKPLATLIEDCKAIYDAGKTSGRVFATGFVLRYANIYRKAKELLDSGRFGRILTIEANEHLRPGHGGYIICFHCSEGTLDLDLYKMQIRFKNIGDQGLSWLNFEGDGHGGGDSFIMKELYDTMTNGTPPKCSGNEGLESAVFALAIDRAAQTGHVVDLEPVWQSLGR